MSIVDFLKDCEPSVSLPETKADTDAIRQLVTQKQQMKGNTPMKKSIRTILVIAAVIGLLTAASTVAYAATDGAALTSAKEAVSTVVKQVTVLFHGKEVTGEKAVNEQGESVTVYSAEDESGSYSMEVNESALDEAGLTINNSMDDGEIVVSTQN